MQALTIMKFGGTSVGDAERILGVAHIIAKNPLGKIVVTSAMSGVTDILIQTTELAVKQKTKELEELTDELRAKHLHTLKQFNLSDTLAAPTKATLENLFTELTKRLDAIGSAKTCSPEHYDSVVSFGERFSIQLVAAAVQSLGVESSPVEATEIIVTSDQFGDAEPLLDASEPMARAVLLPLVEKRIVPVVTGFIGKTAGGKITTLGRGASDYTATILGYCLDVEEVWIWTDVTGVKTADPRLIPEAKTIAHLSYEEAAELSYFGAKVLHPLTMVPASLKNIPIFIKNTFEPAAEGTKISDAVSASGVKAITVMNELSLITVQGKGVTGVPSVAAKVFRALASNKIDVFLISQASSEHNISFVVKGKSSILAVESVHGILSDEMNSKDIDVVQLNNSLSIVAVVGNDMISLQSITSKTFTALGASGVNVTAISYGSSKQSISFVVESSEAVTALKSLHQIFQLVEKE